MTTKQKIIASAKIVFQEKGFAGARMQEIADHSGINKALLHYHFKNKEMLFKAVLMNGVMETFPVILGVLNSTLPLKEKIMTLIESYLTQISSNPELPRFVLNELSQNPTFIKEQMEGMSFTPALFVKQVEEAVLNKEIIPTDPFQVITDIVGMCAFPFIAKPLIQLLSSKNEKEFKAFIVERKVHVQTIMLNGLFIKQTNI